MDDKWTQIIFVVAITAATLVYNHQRKTIYYYEPPAEERIPCATIPSMMERKEDCESALCLWRESEGHLPKCFQPKDAYGYSISGLDSPINATHVAFNLSHERRSYSPFPESAIDVVRFQLIKYNDYIVRFKLSSATDSRYEVPVQETFDLLRRPQNISNPKYVFETGLTPSGYFKFTIRRKGTHTNLIDTGIGGLIMTNQFLQFATYLPSTNFYGFGEHAHHTLRHHFRFNTVAMFARDESPKESANLYGVHPFYMCIEEGGKAHGLFMLNSNAMEYTLLRAPALRLTTIGGVLDFFLSVGDSPTHVSQLYSDLIGRPFLPPYWALGFQLSKFGYNSLRNLKHVVLRNQEARIPMDVQHLDIDYMDGCKTFTVDNDTYGGLGSYVDEMHRTSGLRFLVNLSPALLGNSKTNPPFARGKAADVFVTWPSISSLEDRSNPPSVSSTNLIMLGRLWPCGSVAYVDFFRSATQSWWAKELDIFRKLVHFDGIWMDMNEPTEFSGIEDVVSPKAAKACFGHWKMRCPNSVYDDPPYPTRAATSYGSDERLNDRTLCMVGQHGDNEKYSHYDVHSLYGWSQTVVTHKALESLMEHRHLLISRSTYPSSGRYAGHWLGDNHSKWADLQQSLIGVLEFNMFGIPYVGADICGYFGVPTEELCVRWMQLGAFYPLSRNHNDRGPAEQDPAAFSTRAVEIIRAALQVRYSLLPYLYTLFYEAHRNGTPVVRPLFFEYAEEPHTYGIDKQFMWGSSLLVSPILEENQTYMSFYVPRGLWYNYYTNTPFPSTGEYMILDDVTLSTKTPLYVRAGSVIPTQKPGMSTRDSLKKPFTLLVYPEEGSATGQLFWDDGVSKRTVERNRYDYFEFHVKRCRLTISKTHANEEPLLLILEKVVVMSAFVPTHLYVDGKKRKEAIRKMSDEVGEGHPVDRTELLSNPKAFKLAVQLELHDLRGVHVIEWTTESKNGTECPE